MKPQLHSPYYCSDSPALVLHGTGIRRLARWRLISLRKTLAEHVRSLTLGFHITILTLGPPQASAFISDKCCEESR